MGTGKTGAVDLLVTVNLVLGVFNLLPGFPMDGGRILRAWLARTRPYEQATWIAARTGQVVAVMMGITGVLTLHLMLVFIAVFIFMAAQAELVRTTWAARWGLADGGPVDPWDGRREGVKVRRPG